MPAFDNDLMFRTTGNLTQTETSSALTIRSTPVHGMAVRVVVPSSAGTTNTLLAKVLASNDDSTYYEIARYAGGAQQVAAGGDAEWIIPFATSRKYAKLVLLAAGSTGTPNWGAVKAGIVSRVHADWTRKPDWS